MLNIKHVFKLLRLRENVGILVIERVDKHWEPIQIKQLSW